MIGKEILNYKIVGSIGSGGMADVYLAEQIDIGRKVAIKHLFPQLSKNPSIVKKFIGEAKKMAKIQDSLNHPNVVQVQNYHRDHDGLFIIMEYVPGQDLSQYIDALGAPMDRQEAKKIMLQILDAFVTIHEVGIVHKDVKPSNILITPSKKIKIVDFGISEIVGEDDFNKTKSQAIGTIPYMSPEQVRNQHIDIQSDVYSIGMVYYEMLMGSSPYKMLSSPYEISDKIVNKPLQSLVDTLGDQYMQEWRIIEKATRKDKITRYKNCKEFLQAFHGTVIDDSVVFGCTDPSADNYDPRATIDNGSCKYRDTGDDLLPPPWPPKNWWIWVLALFGAGLIAFLVYVTMIKKTVEFDRKELDELVKEGKYEEALDYLEEHPSDEVKTEQIDRIKDLEELSKI